MSDSKTTTRGKPHITIKKCSSCRRIAPRTEFRIENKRRLQPDDLHTECKECRDHATRRSRYKSKGLRADEIYGTPNLNKHNEMVLRDYAFLKSKQYEIGFLELNGNNRGKLEVEWTKDRTAIIGRFRDEQGELLDLFMYATNKRRDDYKTKPTVERFKAQLVRYAYEEGYRLIGIYGPNLLIYGYTDADLKADWERLGLDPFKKHSRA